MEPAGPHPLLDDIDLGYRGVYLPSHDTVIIADLHLGRGFAAGVEVPTDAMGNVDERLGNLLSRFDPRNVIFAGDVLDAFGTIPPGVIDHLDALVASIRATGASVQFLEGNHDTMLSSLVEQPIEEYLVLGDTSVGHGHEELPGDHARYIIGHHHPSLRIDGVKHPAFLVGTIHDGAQLIVLPAFSDSVRGTVMNVRSLNAIDEPLLVDADVASLRPVVIDPEADEPLVFPPFENLRRFL